MEKIIINNIEIGTLSHLNGCWEAKPSSDEVCRFVKKEEAELYLKQVHEIESSMGKIKDALKKHHSITDVKKIQVNDFEEDGAVFVLSGKLEDIEVLIELWAKDYCIDVYPKDTARWDETVFRGTLLMEDKDGNR